MGGSPLPGDGLAVKGPRIACLLLWDGTPGDILCATHSEQRTGRIMQEMEQAEDDFAQKALVDAVENQIADGHPREAGLVIMDLIGQGVGREEALEKMADVLAAHIAVSMNEETPFDVNAYARDLLQLAQADTSE